MLSYNEIKQKKYIVLDGEPYEVISSHVFRKQQRKPVNQTRLKNLRTGKVIEHSFHQSDSVEEAEIETRKAMYLFKKPHRSTNEYEYWFCEDGNPKERFVIEEVMLGNNPLFLKENTSIEIFSFEQKILGVRLPIKETFVVSDAPPAVKGNTAQGGTKQITIETGAILNAPLFIQEGDKIVVNTDTGEYAGRA
jgi:elongation factor P